MKGDTADRAAASKDAHAADTYTEWLKAEVQASIDDPSPGVPHDEAMRQIRAALVLAYEPED
ncbi:antitoxin [Massilia violaceinigra]|uniref:Antitoxin n=1 Tax=Massilia violaceinigra TaxID=2045208 RepID=A0A2D2DFF2_9BURK|nr:antitoxin [Massilia violaceinigra]ATQ73712.1 antitoxin [Massilia violaceinigra]